MLLSLWDRNNLIELALTWFFPPLFFFSFCRGWVGGKQQLTTKDLRNIKNNVGDSVDITTTEEKK